MHEIVNAIIQKEKDWEREKYNLIQSREKAVMDVYKARNYIDDQLKRKVPAETILTEVHKMLKACTPHGANYQIDP